MSRKSLFFAAAASALAFAGTASAVPQPLVYTDLSTTLAKGGFEFENRIIWSHSGSADEVGFSHEIEYGVTDHFELDFYLSEWSWAKEDGGSGESLWESAGIEGLYAFTNPTTDAIGSAMAVEMQFGDGFWVLEPQIRLQKNFGPLIAMFNLVFENAFNKDGDDEQELSQSLGFAWQITPNFFVGGDVSHATAFTDWGDSHDEWYAGPAVHFRSGAVWGTLAMNFKASADEDDAPDFNLGAKFGFNW